MKVRVIDAKEILKDGIYDAKFFDYQIIESALQKGTYLLRLVFTIQGDLFVSGICPIHSQEKDEIVVVKGSKTHLWLERIAGDANIPPLQNLRGRKCQVVIKLQEREDGRIFPTVVDVLQVPTPQEGKKEPLRIQEVYKRVSESIPEVTEIEDVDLNIKDIEDILSEKDFDDLAREAEEYLERG